LGILAEYRKCCKTFAYLGVDGQGQATNPPATINIWQIFGSYNCLTKNKL